MYRNTLSLTLVIGCAGCAEIIGLDDFSPADPDRGLTISITSPRAGSAVSGVIAVSADARDLAAAIASVKFELPDGEHITDLTAPFAIAWDSTAVTDGSCVIRASATDEQGATATASVALRIDNTGSRGNASSAGVSRPIWISMRPGL
jgi:hypothetical protein